MPNFAIKVTEITKKKTKNAAPQFYRKNPFYYIIIFTGSKDWRKRNFYALFNYLIIILFNLINLLTHYLSTIDISLLTISLLIVDYSI